MSEVPLCKEPWRRKVERKRISQILTARYWGTSLIRNTPLPGPYGRTLGLVVL